MPLAPDRVRVVLRVSARLSCGVMLGMLAVGACGGQTNGSESEPGNAENCDAYSCDCGLSEVSSGGPNDPTTCVGVRFCNSDADCPRSPNGSVGPVCQDNGDNVVIGASGHCVLPCAATADCPSEMQCIARRCVFVTFDPNAACLEDSDCEIESGYRCARDSCEGEGRCQLNDTPCQLDRPVCGCDGTSYPNACDAFPVAVAHEGACR